MKGIVTLGSLFVAAVSSKVYFESTFDTASDLEAWVPSGRKDNGKIDITPGTFFADEEMARGLTLVDEARFYSYTAKLDDVFSSVGDDKDLVFQFTAKYDQQIDCGGAYLKLLPPATKPKEFTGESPYEIMFGPDICGSPNKKVHAILRHKGKTEELKKKVTPSHDQLTHLYTLWIKPNQDFELRVDNSVSVNGTLAEFWDFLPPKQIPDEAAKQPADWVTVSEITDASDTKPTDWVDGPLSIVDEKATKHPDWDDELDGDWEAPVIPNPAYKGEWVPRMIPNPAYKGEWQRPLIDNPEFKEDATLGRFEIGYIGLDIWTVKNGTVFDNILLTDDMALAEKRAKKLWGANVQKEMDVKKQIDAEEAEKREVERKKRVAEMEAQQKKDAEAKDDDKAAKGDEDEAPKKDEGAAIKDAEEKPAAKAMEPESDVVADEPIKVEL